MKIEWKEYQEPPIPEKNSAIDWSDLIRVVPYRSSERIEIPISFSFGEPQVFYTESAFRRLVVMAPGMYRRVFRERRKMARIGGWK